MHAWQDEQTDAESYQRRRWERDTLEALTDRGAGADPSRSWSPRGAGVDVLRCRFDVSRGELTNERNAARASKKQPWCSESQVMCRALPRTRVDGIDISQTRCSRKDFVDHVVCHRDNNVREAVTLLIPCISSPMRTCVLRCDYRAQRKTYVYAHLSVSLGCRLPDAWALLRHGDLLLLLSFRLPCIAWMEWKTRSVQHSWRRRHILTQP